MNLRSLETLGIEPSSYGSLLVPVVKAKLPNEVNLLLSRKFESNTDVWSIQEMLKELKLELEARERCDVNIARAVAGKQPSTTEGLLVQQQGQLC